eukprot:gb/GECG01000175.1/.p1 GENE.gb/GECG01000175.1/~~gb/GECG01000175.1/.p1  ORF type:complete len:240 (+),score=31.70 gb/GECG01000175.1/:1-720(+)
MWCLRDVPGEGGIATQEDIKAIGAITGISAVTAKQVDTNPRTTAVGVAAYVRLASMPQVLVTPPAETVQVDNTRLDQAIVGAEIVRLDNISLLPASQGVEAVQRGKFQEQEREAVVRVRRESTKPVVGGVGIALPDKLAQLGGTAAVPVLLASIGTAEPAAGIVDQAPTATLEEIAAYRVRGDTFQREVGTQHAQGAPRGTIKQAHASLIVTPPRGGAMEQVEQALQHALLDVTELLRH